MKLTASLLLALIISLNSFSQSGWVKQYSGVNTPLNTFYFNNLYTGYTAGDGGKILKTTNGGINWLIYNTYESCWFSTIWFININTGFVGAINNYSYKTTNGGVNWNIYFSSGNDRYQYQFINDLTGYSVGPGYQVMKTTDGGMNWVFKNPYSTTSFYMLSAVNADTVYFGGGLPIIFKTTNGGDSYLQMSSPNNRLPSSLFFVDAETGYCTGFGPPYFLAKTTNGGAKWTNIIYSNKIKYYDIKMINDQTGFIIADKIRTDFLLKTTNAGENWTKSFYYDNWLQTSYFINENTGYVSGYDGAIFKTTNGGDLPVYSVSGIIKYADNNQTVSSGKVKAIKHFIGSNQFIAIDSAEIQADGSYVMPYLPQDSLYIMAFQDDEDNSAFVPTYYQSTIFWQNAGIIYPSSNLTGIDVYVFRNNAGPEFFHIGGNISTNSSSMNYLPDAIVYAKSGNNFMGYSVSNNSGNYRIDKLQNGNYEIIVDLIGYRSSRCIQQVNGLSIDDLNFILQSYLIGVDPPGNPVPENFWLGQNYPNPFNPTTTIRFSIPPFEGSSGRIVTVTIYDILGREVATLVNEQLKPGTYEVEWDGREFSSGIYFYKLISGNYLETKKMVLLK